MFKKISSFLSTFFFFAIIVFVFLIGTLVNYNIELPNYQVLEKYEPPVTTRLFAGNGELLMEYANEKRIFVPIDKMPQQVKNAFISAEDKSFYTHGGVDYKGIIRAALGNLKNLGSGKRPTGASTITQQVAKNFLLSSEVSYVRKLKEIILARKMEKAFTKDHILELYLNEIYLGNRAYGVAAAALNYFGKSLNDLELEELAYLAALPKGPNNYNPKTQHDAALARRNWVLTRMAEDGYITEEQMLTAQSKPLTVIDRNNMFVHDAEYFSEEVRREISNNFGADALYEGGLIVRTTLDPRLQSIATKVFRENIKNYDIRHGYRGAVANIPLEGNWQEEFNKIEMPKGADPYWEKAIVLEVSDINAEVMLSNNEKVSIPMALLSWARKTLADQRIGETPKKASDILNKGDIIFVEKASEETVKTKKLADNSYELRQIPNLDGGMIVVEPHTGKVLAVVGGYSFFKSQFNRATQAMRQTGSAFKPVVYLTALENGYSPTDLILDAPFVVEQGVGLPNWKPENYSNEFYGLTTMRIGLELSRNLMTVRLAQDVGMDKVAEEAKKLGVNDHLPPLLSMSLGAGETRLIDLSMAYTMMVNGGKRVKPYFIERIQDRNGATIFKQDNRECQTCSVDKWDNQTPPVLSDNREQVIDPLSAYQMVSMLEGVAIRGTGARLRHLGKHLAGKTGTTNDMKDAWFMGFSPDLVVGVYVGFDEPRTIGSHETGASAALPAFYDFMKEALANQPDSNFRIPNGIKLVRVNFKTGKPASVDDSSVIYEALKPDFNFDENRQRVIGDDKDSAMSSSTGGDDEIQLGTQY